MNKTETPDVPKIQTDTDIVAGLRNEDPVVRRAALNALFPERSAVLISCGKKSIHLSSTTTIDAPRIFQGLLVSCSQIGRVLGLELNWMPRTEGDHGPKLVVAQPGDIVMP